MMPVHPPGRALADTLAEDEEKALYADRLGFDGIVKGSHYSAHPFESVQQIPFLSYCAAIAPRLRLICGLVLVPLHKPLDLAEQLATLDLLCGGKLVFGAGIGYRDVEFKAFGVPHVEHFTMRPELREDRPGRGSDQTSFINNLVPAVRFIESHECSSSPVDNSCPAALDPNNPNSALTNGRPCPSPYAALPRTDPRHNCLHTNFAAAPATLDGVDVSVKVCANADERAHGVSAASNCSGVTFTRTPLVEAKHLASSSADIRKPPPSPRQPPCPHRPRWKA